MGKRILVTGGAGFLGSHLCSALLEDGNEVICLDNFFTGSKSNIVNLLNNPYFELIRHDICFPIYLEIDQIYNLASRPVLLVINWILFRLQKQIFVVR